VNGHLYAIRFDMLRIWKFSAHGQKRCQVYLKKVSGLFFGIIADPSPAGVARIAEK